MTCIIGIVDNGVVYIGGDSAGVSGSNIHRRKDTKVFGIKNERSSFFLIGFTTSFRMGQLLRFKLELPVIEKDLYEYMCTDFIDAVRKCLKDGGYSKEKDGEESGGNFLVGVEGRLFEVHSDYQVAESETDFLATGCGEYYARGSLFTSVNKKPYDRIIIALEAATEFSTGVCGPYTLMDSETCETNP
jgi:ATP-dependent protease HslVU (ClpYQ) peptidase subunit